MQTTRGSGLAAGTIFIGGGTTMRDQLDDRTRRLQDEAARERVAGPREGLRQHVGHALIAVGRAIHGLEPEPGQRTVLPVR